MNHTKLTRIPSFATLLALGLFVSFATKSSAVLITLESQVYDVTAYTPGAPSAAIVDLLNDQPWWNDEALAASAAAQVNSQLGIFYGDYSPFFAASTTGGFLWFDNISQGVGFADWYPGFTFAVATAVPAPDASATLGLLGLAMIGLAGLRRKFCKA